MILAVVDVKYKGQIKVSLYMRPHAVLQEARTELSQLFDETVGITGLLNQQHGPQVVSTLTSSRLITDVYNVQAQ